MIDSVRRVLVNGGAVDLTNYLPKGFSKTGNVDYTVYMQRGIDQNKKVIFPNFPVLINGTGLKLHSGMEVLFQKNSVIRLLPNNLALYGVLWLKGVSNINIYFPNLMGDKWNHKGTKGQWGMGMFITSSYNINIIEPYISKMWGDGIYIGQDGNIVSKQITVLGGILDNNRRNGVSIVSGEDIKLDGIFISNTDGVSPSSGIDIEPNENQNELKSIALNNITTFNNSSRGILIALDYLNGTFIKRIGISINNHNDTYSPVGLEVYSDRGNGNKLPNRNVGVISVSGGTYNSNSKAGILSGAGKQNNIHLSLKGIKNGGVISSKLTLDKVINNFNKGTAVRLN